MMPWLTRRARARGGFRRDVARRGVVDRPGVIERPGVVDRLEPRTLLSGSLSISELLASNTSGLPDGAGRRYDWVEVHNAAASPASAAGYSLTDDPAVPRKWVFPDVTIPARGHLVVFASGLDRRVAGQELHANFNLNADGEYLALVEPDGSTVATQFSPTFPQQQQDISYGFDPASPGAATLRYFATPSPRTANVRSEVVINEIHYDPDVKTELTEFVELHNPGAAAVDLSGAYFQGITFEFPAGTTLPAGGYLVIAQNAQHFQTKFGAAPFGQYAGALSNEGDVITLRNRSGGKLDEVDYRPGFPWPTVGDAPGYSIELVNPDFDNSVGGNWRAQPPAAAQERTLLAPQSDWRYLPGRAEASNPKTAWRQPGFTDAGWDSGRGPIGYDGGGVPMNTVLSDMRNEYTSVFMRGTFNVTDPSQVGSLRLEALVDDGFNVWVNGVHAHNHGVPSDDAAYNALATLTAEDNTYRPFNLKPAAVAALRPGANTIAVQFFNVLLGVPGGTGSSDAFFDARLVATLGGGGASPTPGRVNSVRADNVAPQMRRVNHTPEQPKSGEVVTVTTLVTDPDGVSSVSLKYQAVNPGNYINRDDAAYETDWTTVVMNDAGTGGDAVAGDGVYSAQLPAEVQTNRRLVRYRVTATDGRGASVTAPYADDSVPNFAYFVYDGVPGWSGKATPSSAVVNYTPEVMNELPAYHLISKNSDVEDATWFSKYGGDNYLWKGTLVYDGAVYDHVSYRMRGGVWRYAMVKNMWKIDFNHNHGFQAKDDYGRPYKTTWDKLNLGANIQQGDFNHRGEQGLFESVGMKLFNLAGAEAPLTNYVQFRVIDDAAEAGPTQFEGDLWGLYLAIEQPDGNFLDEHGLPDGNLYKMDNRTGELNNQGPTQPTDKSDLIAFQAGYASQPAGAAGDQWFRDNMNLDSYYGYRTIVEAIHHYDIDESPGKNYFFYHNPVTDKWETTVWDLDLTWADNMYGGGDEPFRDVVLPRPAFNVEYRNRIRELRDLLWNADQTGALIDEMAAKVWTKGQPSWVDVDRAMWDYNPRMLSPNGESSAQQKAGQGRFYGAATNPARTFEGMQNKMKAYIASRWTSVLEPRSRDAAIPNKPTVTYVGAAGHPADGLRFGASAFADPQGANTFAAMEWRVGEITNPAAPGYDPKAPKKYEIESLWESGELSTFTGEVEIPAHVVRAGRTYRVRVRMKDSTGRWSNWSDATAAGGTQFLVGAPDAAVKDSLRITELHYHPAPDPAGPFADDEFEFVELRNVGTRPINLEGVKFTKGIDYTFGDVTLEPGQYVVVAVNREAFLSRYPDEEINLAPGAYLGHLENSGERVELEDAAEQVIHDFTYSKLWHPTTDGDGPSLVIRDPLGDLLLWGDPEGDGWRPSAAAHGSPGRDDTPQNDTTPPTADVVDVTPDPRNTPVDSITIVFSEPVTGFDLSDLMLHGPGGEDVLTGSQSLSSADGRTWTLGNLARITAAPGTYMLMFLPNGSIHDAAGNAMTVLPDDFWTVLPPLTADIVDVFPDPRTSAVDSVRVVFSSPVTGFDLNDLPLAGPGGTVIPYTAAQTLASTDGGTTWVIGNLAGLTRAAGTYRMQFQSGSGILDGAGATLTTLPGESWTVLPLTADIVDVAPDPRTTSVDSIDIVFSEPVTGFDLADLVLLPRKADPVPANRLTAAQTLTTTDGVRWTLGNLAPVTGPLGGGYYLFLNGGAATGIRDADGNLFSGSVTEEWTTVAVVGRRAFYNNSSFDGLSPAANAADDAAVAADKAPLLPGQTPAFANFTTFASGINGIMIDVAGIPEQTVRGPLAGDFVFKMSDPLDPTRWVDAPAPASVQMRRGAGEGGSDRITLTWADRAIRNRWLQVTVKPGISGSALPTPDVFYFGSLVGDTGDGTTTAAVNALDLAAVKRVLNTAAEIPSRFDFDRSGRVNALDLAAVKANLNRSLSLQAAAAAVAAAPFGAVRVTAPAAWTPSSAWDALDDGADRAVL